MQRDMNFQQDMRYNVEMCKTVITRTTDNSNFKNLLIFPDEFRSF